MAYKFFDKKSCVSGAKYEIMWNQRPSDLVRVAKFPDRTRQLAEEVHEPIIKKSERQKVHSSSIDNIWRADLADM